MNASFADSGVFNIHVEFLKRIRNPFMHTDLHLESDNGKYDLELLNSTVDLCEFYKNKRFKPVVQMILKLFEEHFTYWFKSCPVKKVNKVFFMESNELTKNILQGVYYLKNVELNVEKLPPFFPEKNGVFKSTVFDKHEPLYHLQIFFQIVKAYKKKFK